MRDLERNKQLIHYSNLSEDTTDEWGNKAKGYGKIQEYRISLSVDKGEASNNAFGKDLEYDREMVTHDMKCPINEHTHLWIDNDTSKPYDYSVVKKANSLNSIRYAIKRENVS